MSIDTTRARTLHSKRSFGKYPKIVDSPAYDASEEDNDPLTDDGQSSTSATIASSSISRLTGSHLPRSSHLKHTTSSTRNVLAKHHLAHHNILSDSDGVDGDVESSTTAAADTGATHKISHHYHLYQNSTSSLSTLGIPASATVEPSSATMPNTTAALIDTPVAPLSGSQSPNLADTQVLGPSVPAEVKDGFNPAAWTPQDIQAFVMKAIQGDPPRHYKINMPPTHRPVRIYADGVYDLFHFGHALQLRQAKLSFPSVYLLVGVNSDELVRKHKARTVMQHAERLEAVKHCRWVDEVVAEAPWILDESFLQKYEIDYVAHDEDLYASAGHEDVYHYTKSQGKFIPTRRTPGVSTSELLGRIVSGYRRCEFDDKLTKMGFAELRAKGSDYDGSRSPTTDGKPGIQR